MLHHARDPFGGTSPLRRIVPLILAALLALSSVMSASAAPITCPGNLEPAKAPQGGEWYCESPSGNQTGAGWHKNPNKGKL